MNEEQAWVAFIVHPSSFIVNEDERMKDLDTLITAMYDAVCWEAPQRPKWHIEEQIFAPGVRLVRVTDEGVFQFDYPSYRANLEAMVDSGELRSFWEGELWRETRLFDDVAHILSAYETRRSRGGELLNRGVNSIQAFRREGRWWISAMIWRREGRGVRIPLQPTGDPGR